MRFRTPAVAALTLPLAACCNPPDLRANWYFVSEPASAASTASAAAEASPAPRSGYEDLRMNSRLKLAILNHDRMPVTLHSVLVNPLPATSPSRDGPRTWQAEPAFTLASGEMWVLDVTPPEMAAGGGTRPAAAPERPPVLARCQIPVFVRVVACRATAEGAAAKCREGSALDLTVPGAMPSALPDGWETCRGTPAPAPH